MNLILSMLFLSSFTYFNNCSNLEAGIFSKHFTLYFQDVGTALHEAASRGNLKAVSECNHADYKDKVNCIYQKLKMFFYF